MPEHSRGRRRYWSLDSFKTCTGQSPFLVAFSVFSVFSDGHESECLGGHGWPREAVVQSLLL